MLSHFLRAIPKGEPPPPPVITIIGSTSDTKSNGTQMVVSKPSGTESGDLLLLFVSSASNTVGTPSSSGFTMYADQNSPVSSVLYKVAGSSEPSTYSVSSGQTQPAICCLVAIRNHTSGLVLGSWSASGTGTTITAPSITMPSSGLLFAFYSMRIEIGETGTLSQPSGMNTTLNLQSTGSAYIGVFNESRSSGATGTKSSNATSTGTITYHRSILIGVY